MPIFGACGVVAASGFYTYRKHPDLLLKWFLRYQLYKQNFKVKYIKNGERTFCYAHRVGQSSKPLLLMIHGFSASKDMWVWMAKYLPSDVEVICLDLPGHGETSVNESDDLLVSGQADIVHDFVSLLGLNKESLHVCGQSMGGAIAGTYASKYPTSLKMATMLCPAMRTPNESKFLKAILGGDDIHDWLIPETPNQVQKMFSACTYNAKPSSPTILNAVCQLRKPRNEFFMKLWGNLFNDLQNQDDHLRKYGKVSVPLQVIWGEHDDIIDVSGCQVVAKNNPHTRVDVVPRCGHSLAMERSRKVANLVMEFQNDVLNKKD